MLSLLDRTRKWHRWFMLVPLMAAGLWFSVMERVVTHPDIYLHIWLDDYIPFVAEFVIPYVIWYFYVGLTAFYLFWANPREFVRMALFLSLGMQIACIIYGFFPNGQALRPPLTGAENAFCRLIHFIYSVDSPANCSPSIHVVYSISAHIALRRQNNRYWEKKWVNPLSFFTAFLCSISTVFIKQHSAQDIFSGILLCIFLYWLIYLWLPRYATKKTSKQHRQQQWST